MPDTNKFAEHIDDGHQNLEQNLDRISEEEQETIIKDTDKLIEEMTKNQEDYNQQYDSWKKEEKKGVKGGDSESYDMNKARKNAVKNKEKNQHRLGFHRRYLESPIRISNVVLTIVFIAIAIFLAVCFLTPNVLPKAPL